MKIESSDVKRVKLLLGISGHLNLDVEEMKSKYGMKSGGSTAYCEAKIITLSAAIRRSW
jgi:hypothetical protein